MIILKKKSIAKAIWIFSIFIELILILIIVIDYKVNFQYLTKNKLYFYDCKGLLCVSEIKNDQNLLYSYYDCGNDLCPNYEKDLNDTYAILKENNLNYLYNYREGKIISKEYDEYQVLNNENFIVTKNGMQGLIDVDNNLIIEIVYEQLGYNDNNQFVGYNSSQIIAKKDNKYGVISYKTGEIVIPFTETIDTIDKLLTIINNN